MDCRDTSWKWRDMQRVLVEGLSYLRLWHYIRTARRAAAEIIVAPRGEPVQPSQGYSTHRSQRWAKLAIISSFSCFSFTYTTHPYWQTHKYCLQPRATSPCPLHLRRSTPNLNTIISTVHGILTFTFSTTTNSSAGPFLLVRRRAISSFTQLKWQDMVRA